MNHGPLIFLGIFAAMATGWYVMIVTPLMQLRDKQPVETPPANIRYPNARPGLAQQGREIYRALGCQYCHTQQVRPQGFGADIERGWGVRFTVAQDYLFERPLMLGNLRIGPDLANIGARQTNEVWHFLHLYDPDLTVKGSTMPPYSYLFTKQPISGAPSPEGIVLPPESGGQPQFEIVPSLEARALVAYLQSLRADAQLLEAPIPPPPGSEEAEGATNQAPGAVETNAPSESPVPPVPPAPGVNAPATQ